MFCNICVVVTIFSYSDSKSVTKPHVFSVISNSTKKLCRTKPGINSRILWRKTLRLYQFIKKTTSLTNGTIVQWVQCPIYQKYLRNLCTVKFIHNLSDTPFQRGTLSILMIKFKQFVIAQKLQIIFTWNKQMKANKYSVF